MRNNQMISKIGLISFMNTGHGFKSPAIAISEELTSLGVKTINSDTYKDIGMYKFDNFLVNAWKLFLKYPILFDLVYYLTYHLPLFINNMIAKKAEKGILKQLNEIKPDFILSTHFMTNFAYSYAIRKNNLDIPLYCYNSDVIVSHKQWVCNSAKKYFISTNEGIIDSKKFGQTSNSIKLSSFAIDPKFKKKYSSQKIERENLKLKNKFTATIMLGGEGIGESTTIINKLIEDKVDIQIIFICGRNEILKKQLKDLASKNPDFDLSIQGFVTNMNDFIYCSDIVLGKSGLNFVFESIYLKKPFIVTKAMANEKFVAKYLVKNDIGLYPKTTSEIVNSIKKLMKYPSLSNKYVNNMGKLKISFKTEDIANEIINDF